MTAAGRYSAADIHRIGSEVAEAIELAVFGTEAWSHVTDTVVRAFPGSFCAVLNQDFVNGRLNRAVATNLEREFFDSFLSHYTFVNPWNYDWINGWDGRVLVAERDRPASTTVGTEFYHDWLVPTGRFAATGLKIDASPEETIYFPLHYDRHLSHIYDEAAERVMMLLRGPLRRAVQQTEFLRGSMERDMSAAAMLGRSGQPCFVVDATMRLVEASQSAIDLMASGGFLRSHGNRVSFADTASTERLSRAVRSLAHSITSETSRFAWEHKGQTWVARLFRISPVLADGWLLAARPLVLVLLTNLNSRATAADLSVFARVFHLTPAETMLCAALADGLTLTEAAIRCGITHETARGRIKAIFAKTETSRQAELCVLLERYVNA